VAGSTGRPQGLDKVRLHRAYIARRTDIDLLVGALPDAVVRSDGPAPSHAWERQLRDLVPAIRELRKAARRLRS
jgi:hypothetical protein